MALDIDSIYEKLIGRKAGSEGKGYWTQQYNTATTGENKQTSEAVSYTHLTLPTICSV